MFLHTQAIILVLIVVHFNGSGGENRTPIMGFGDPYTAIVLHRNVTAAPDVASKVPIEARTIVVTIYELARQCLLQF